jgi:hypothetical protein
MAGAKKMHAICTAKKAKAKEKEETAKKAKAKEEEEICDECNPKGKGSFLSWYDCTTCQKKRRQWYLSKLGLSIDQDNLPNIKITYEKIISQAHPCKNLDPIHNAYYFLKRHTLP